MAIRSAIVASVVALALAGCVGPGTPFDEIKNVDPASFHQISKPITLPRGSVAYDCGPEALSAVLRFWGREVGVEEVSRQIYDEHLKGSCSTQLAPLARQLGFAARYVEHAAIGTLKESVDADVPAIIMVKVADDLYHFFVVTGYSDKEQMVLCEDYDNKKRAVPYKELEELWEPTRHFLLEITASTAESEYARASDAEAQGAFEDASRGFERAITMDPTHEPSYVGLGNCRLAIGQRDEAIQMYERALQYYANDPKAMNNLAHALWESGQNLQRARDLAERAVDTYRERIDNTRRILDTMGGLKERPTPAWDSSRADLVKRLNESELELALSYGTLASIRYALGEFALAVTAWKASYDLLPLAQDQLRARRLAMIAKSYRELQVMSQYRVYRQKAIEEAPDADLKSEFQTLLPED